jgi:hypothetical protein
MKITIPTYRHAFSKDVIDTLNEFSRIHRHDDLTDFKKYWGVLLHDNRVLFSTEHDRLVEGGFKGNVMDAMFKSSRFYYRKLHLNNNPTKSVNKKRYMCLTDDFLHSIDKHIERTISLKLSSSSCKDSSSFISHVNPATSYTDFCSTHLTDIRIEVDTLIANIKAKNDSPLSGEDIIFKFKKTYKNRFYVIQRKIGGE